MVLVGSMVGRFDQLPPHSYCTPHAISRKDERLREHDGVSLDGWPLWDDG